MGKTVVVVPPDPSWVERFEAVAAWLRGLLGDELLAVHHVGSTSVPGLWAKPKVDIMPVVRSHARLEEHRATVEAAGYLWRGEYGIPGRRYFRTEQVNIHVYEPGHHEIARHLCFRDHLRAHAEAREAYQALKRELAQRFVDEPTRYQDGKSELIERLLREAMGADYVGP